MWFFVNATLTGLKIYFNFRRNIFVELWLKTCNFSLMLTMFLFDSVFGFYVSCLLYSDCRKLSLWCVDLLNNISL